jgi:hypothetical protein
MRKGKYPLSLLLISLIVCSGFTQSFNVEKKETSFYNTAAQIMFNLTAGVENNTLPLGRYELYSGIPAMYLGHFILLGNGKYKVAFNTDEANYDESGVYKFHAETNTIEWISGMFKNNNWGGKLVKKDKGFTIEFNKATYGDSK